MGGFSVINTIEVRFALFCQAETGNEQFFQFIWRNIFKSGLAGITAVGQLRQRVFLHPRRLCGKGVVPIHRLWGL